ncbi:amidohydrolase family protein [Candidatus Mycobacterium methanotrophicum]|uniref:Amidohydrolase family protein n=1 Tax=Candidatus Mycobacterium methanotrophicum TaxID=2943498 RepID=A0ABY4QL62_9MYCO|nr:amidohydrolase family protein [Candidatus Mycobacterium methanotrophicum]UQX10539.1 amidohydrolase family protein [Candidatus Mycobacterium methanotrophicum]
MDLHYGSGHKGTRRADPYQQFRSRDASHGAIVDGLGGEPHVGDVAVRDGVIAAVGHLDGERAAREIDATGLLVTSGFVELHTHYDGQSIWLERLTPSSAHGVTTALMGNCGVGFAPCRQSDHDVLVDVMAGVEDIPGVVMPTVCRGLGKPSPNTSRPWKKAGVTSTWRSTRRIPSYGAAREEIEEIARGVVDGGGRLLQFVSDIPAAATRLVLQTMFDVAEDVGLPLTFTFVVANAGDPTWEDAIAMIEKANTNARAGGAQFTAQLLPRPIGLIIGLQLSANPFVLYPSYREISHLPLAERVAEMRKPEVRVRILADEPGVGRPMLYVTQMWDWIFPLDDNPNYEPDPADSIGARARVKGVDPMEEAYDRLLDAGPPRPGATRLRC